MKLIKLRCCKAGSIILKLFLALICGFGAAYLFDLFSEPFGFSLWRENKTLLILQVFAVILFCSVVFWIGIILVYSCSSQLRMKTRVLGILFAWIPILNIVMLIIIIHTADKEYRFEKKKYDLDQSRREQKICSTKYPLLLVHGVFFRDFEHLNYWGRIPKELEENGASVYYGNHNSASPVAESAEQLKKRLFEIVGETGCGKVNIIAHSKGGLDARYLLSDPEAARHVASLTTINTPHRGCRFADYLFEKTSEKFKKTLADKFISFSYTDALAGLVAEKSYSVKYGARNMRRFIQTEIEDRIAGRIIEARGKLSAVSADVSDGEITVSAI